MNNNSKVISGFRKSGDIPISERHKIINEFINSGCTKQEIWQRYTGEVEEHGYILRWMRQLGYINELPKRRINFASMKKVKPKEEPEELSFETLQLNKRIAELESQLKDAEMKAIAFSTMVDIAEKEFKIPIRKKLNTKP